MLLAPTWQVRISSGRKSVLVEAFLASKAAKQLAAYDEFVRAVAECKKASKIIRKLEWPTEPGYHAAKVSKLMNKLQKELLAGHFKTADTATLTSMSQWMESFMEDTKRAEKRSDSNFALLYLLNQGGEDLARGVRALGRDEKVSD